jgi:hypothetical protein
MPDDEELSILRRLLAQQRDRFTHDPEAARQLLAIGASPAGRDLDSAELAAWSATAHAIINLDEAITCR